jgi:DNA-binding NtrC family response regulator
MPQYPDLKIFIVDDDIFCLTLYEQLLRNLGYTDVTPFTSGDDCLDRLQNQPGLVFLDYNMEGLNGIEVLKRIKAFNPAIIVYIISGQENNEIAVAASKHGALDYIVKSSLSPDKIATVMDKAEQLYIPAAINTKKSLFAKLKSGLGI